MQYRPVYSDRTAPASPADPKIPAESTDSVKLSFLPPAMKKHRSCGRIAWLEITTTGGTYRVRFFLRSRSGARRSHLMGSHKLVATLGETNLMQLRKSVTLRAVKNTGVMIQLESIADRSRCPRNELTASGNALLALWNRADTDPLKNVVSRYTLTVSRKGEAERVTAVTMLDAKRKPIGNCIIE
jgi:hypothetical protein